MTLLPVLSGPCRPGAPNSVGIPSPLISWVGKMSFLLFLPSSENPRKIKYFTSWKCNLFEQKSLKMLQNAQIYQILTTINLKSSKQCKTTENNEVFRFQTDRNQKNHENPRKCPLRFETVKISDILPPIPRKHILKTAIGDSPRKYPQFSEIHRILTRFFSIKPAPETHFPFRQYSVRDQLHSKLIFRSDSTL